MVTLGRQRHAVVIALGYLVGLVIYARLQQPALPHLVRLLMAFALPTTAAVIYAVVSLVWAKDVIRDRETSFQPTYDSILFAVILFVASLQVLVMAALAEALPLRTNLARATVVLFGLLVARIGNLLPRTRPNLAFGIRTRRTLSDRSAWMQTHRIAGYTTVLVGTVMAVGGALLSKRGLEMVVGPVALTGAAVLLALHCRPARAKQTS